MNSSTATADPATLDSKEIFSHFPANRVGDADRRYVNELFETGFGNWESAGMLGRFETAFARKFGVHYAISMNSGSGTLLSCLLGAGGGASIHRRQVPSGNPRRKVRVARTSGCA